MSEQVIPESMQPHAVRRTSRERQELLDSSGWLREYDWRQLDTLADYFDTYVIPAGTRLFEEGDSDTYLAVVAQGRV